ncbi:class III lanthionine synthetase LanKC [Hoyosella subflava]|uniref:Protein kinase domain-containing protein n=1 Tax=Hoyosella subflava (strain DSM 45089 / JCM 17490 / NBRC 109087 / DQS3-9A1) TaxID=443218 RepID=F6ESD8_HOYSD|nr:class III lanthionine synthetase LanKC [Hoyosella subflava]AEF43059.1 hypothetical protein AS9A_P20015 [Hoyosella subflava DQS3-9A1]
MDARYAEYTVAGSLFYDCPHVQPIAPGSRGMRLHVSHAVSWQDWRQHHMGRWVSYAPAECVLPEQGWKIHCSATLENAAAMLERVSRYCAEQRIAFKHLRSTTDLTVANSKQAPRASSGKFLTLYPVSEQECETTAADLDDLIGGRDGPYILSDVRYREGPVYLRYGAFHLLFTLDPHTGDPVPAVRAPDGTLIPDQRRPVFTPPPWVKIPGFVEHQLEALHASDADLPYTVEGALHYSNGGGVYKAAAANGHRVVLKEGRPFAGLDPRGRDASARIRDEHALLTRFANDPAIVAVLDRFQRCGHEFLVLERVTGTSLLSEITARNPLVRARYTRADIGTYRTWAMSIANRIETTLNRVHHHNVAYADLHPGNVICRPDGGITLLDFEFAYDLNAPHPLPAGPPGYTPPDNRTGVAADRYALGCLKLALFLPLTSLLALSPSKLEHLLAVAAEEFSLPFAYLQSIRDLISLDPPFIRASKKAHEAACLTNRWNISTPTARGCLTRLIRHGIYDTADLSRADRVFPGDIEQFTTNGYNIAHGASGILLAVMPPEHLRDPILDWIHTAATETSDTSPGFFDGLAGAAHLLRRYHRDHSADTLTARLSRLDFERYSSHLYNGLAGIGCHLIDEAATHPAPHTDRALADVREILAHRAHALETHPHAETHPPGISGLMRGASGQALFWSRHYEHTSDPASLATAHALITHDLTTLTRRTDGSLQTRQGNRTLPYLASGSTGVGLVLLELLRHEHRDDYLTVLDGITAAATPALIAQSGLFNGRAGLLYYLTALAATPYAPPSIQQKIRQQRRLLQLHAIPYRTGIHFPGEHNLRLSTDLATGSAGIHYALTPPDRTARTWPALPQPHLPHHENQKPEQVA